MKDYSTFLLSFLFKHVFVYRIRALPEPLGVFSIRCHPARDKVSQANVAGRTSEERPAACSSAISAWESSYKKHLLHFVLSMMLWKINTVMVFLPLCSLLLAPASVSVHLRSCKCGSCFTRLFFGNKNMQLNKYDYGDVKSWRRGLRLKDKEFFGPRKPLMWATSSAVENSYCTGLLPFAALDPQVSAFIDSAIGKTVVTKCTLK